MQVERNVGQDTHIKYVLVSARPWGRAARGHQPAEWRMMDALGLPLPWGTLNNG